MQASRRTAAAGAVTVLAIVLSGCGSDGKTEKSSSSSTATSAASSESTPSPAPPADQTVAEYIKTGGITQTVALSGANGAPTVDLPFPEGWTQVKENLPEGSYGGIAYTGPDTTADFPPTIFAFLSRLDGPADPAKILELAPNELRELAAYAPIAPGGPGKLGGFDAYELAGTANLQGTPRFIAQKTVVIPGPDGLYLLLLNAYSTVEQQDKVVAAMGVVDAETTITF